MAAVVVVIGLGMGSCVDKADNSTAPSGKEQQAEDAKQEKAQKYWAVVSHLVDVDDYTVDYADKTFEPTYGVSQGDDGTRYVFTNTAAAAAARFADLVERDDIDENTQTYTYNDPDVGKLVYTKGTGRILATVDVSIKQIPTLKKIVYVPGAYANGSFRGRAYYRFGDVVKRQVQDYDGNDVDEYWICVRPSFGPESKGDSHWVCLNVLPKKNVNLYHSKTNGNDYYMPQGLGTDKENMQNLAEMLYAIYFSEQWQTNVRDNANTDLEMFSDFDRTKYTLHNQNFWQSVRNAWKHFGILENALDYPLGEEAFTDMLQKDGLNILYDGYSWPTWRSWYCTLYEACYKNGNDNKEKNMHKASYTKVETDMKDVTLDCRQMGLKNIPKYNTFFGDNLPRWAVRHATGKELATDRRYNAKTAITGVVEVYRYYRDVFNTDQLMEDPEETGEVKVFGDGPIAPEEVKVGNVIGKSGQFYKTAEDAHIADDDAVAMVVYLGGNKCVEKDKDWNGLAIALEDAKKNDEARFEYRIGGQEDKSCCTAIAARDHLVYRLDGWAMTKQMKEKACGNDHSHPAAETVWTKTQIEGCSEWFIPATGQWDLAMQGMRYGKYSYSDGYWGYHEEGHWLWEETGAVDAELRENGYMTVTASNDNNSTGYYTFRYTSLFNHLEYRIERMNTMAYVRPFLAFKVGNGGSVNPEEPWKPLEQPKVRSWIGTDSKFYNKRIDAQTNTGKEPVAYVVYLGGDKRVEKDKDWNGLAIALKDLEDRNGNKQFKYCGEGQDLVVCTNNASIEAHLAGRCDGWAMTQRLKNHACNAEHSHPGAEAVGAMAKMEGFSEWFIPSTGQWDLAMDGMGYGKYTETDVIIGGSNIWVYEKKGNADDIALNDNEYYMSSTEYTRKQYNANEFNDVDGKCYSFRYRDNYDKIQFLYFSKTEDYSIRPFIAFKYGQGGRVNPEEPWAPLPAPQAKSWMGEDGRFYKTTYDAWSNTGYLPVAYAAYYSADKTITVNGKDYHGLGIAIYTQLPEFEKLAWVDIEDKMKRYKTRLTDKVRQEKGFSAWFVPSKEHWQIALEKGFDCQFDGNTVVEKEKGSKKTEMFDFYCDCDMRISALVGPFWTATTTDNDQAYYIDLMAYHTIQFLPFDKKATQVSKASTSAFCLRPMIAF